VWLPAVLVAAGVLLTPVYLVVRAAEGGAAGAWELLADVELLRLLWRTVSLAAVVTAACVVLGVAAAFLTTRTDLPGRRVLAVATALPLVVPTYVGAYALVATFAPGGLFQDVVRALGLDVTTPSPYGFWGAAIALTLFSYPYVLLTVQAAVRGLDPSLEEASLTLGVGAWATFWRVTVPQLRPATASGALLVTLYVLSDFGAVTLLRYSTFTRVIYLRYSATFDRSSAAVLALALVVVTLVVLVAEARAGRARVDDLATGGGGTRRDLPVLPLGRWRWPAAALCWGLVVLALVGPVAVAGTWLVRGLMVGEDVLPDLGTVLRTLQAAGFGAVAAALAAVPIATWSTRSGGRLARFVERASFTGYALPGIVVALSLVFVGVRLGPLYQSTLLLVIAYVVLFLPQAVGAVRASLLQVPGSLEEAARTLGDGPTRALFRAVLPLARGGAASGAALVFLTVVKELPATLLLAPTGFDTLATRVWATTTEAFFARAALPALLLLVVGSVPLAVLTFGPRRRDR
jgi:iron(III) transport system permease protein